jgi:hypothetical protein
VNARKPILWYVLASVISLSCMALITVITDTLLALPFASAHKLKYPPVIINMVEFEKINIYALVVSTHVNIFLNSIVSLFFSSRSCGDPNGTFQHTKTFDTAAAKRVGCVQ